MKAKTIETKRYPLDPGGEPLEGVKSYDVDPKASYSITHKDEPAGEGQVERDANGQLWVTPGFDIAFEEVKFRAFWRPEGDKGILAGIVMVVRESPTQPWV
jgi:hypothetical protein